MELTFAIEIRLADHGTSLGPRVLGKQICDQALNHLKTNAAGTVIFNFENITTLSSGFAFDLFSELKRVLGDHFKEKIKFRFTNCPGEQFVKSILYKALTV